MKKNLGLLDRIIRAIIAVFIVWLYYMDYLTGNLAYVLLAAAAIYMATSLASSCPLYIPFGINTYKSKE